jgi:glycosyltransferase involved in cell wall biosynthesis
LPGHLLKMIAAFNRLRPKAVFAQLDDPNLLCGLAGRICDVPRVVMSFRNYNPSHFDWIHRGWYLPSYRLVARSGAVRFTGNSLWGNADYADWIGIPRERVHYTPNVLDPTVFIQPGSQELAELRASLGITPDTPVVLGPFRLHPEKDPFTFLEVARRLVRSVPGIKVLHAGDGYLRAALEQRVAESGLGANVQLLGDRQDMNLLMSLADVVLLTSAKEGMSNVAAEAQLMGTPVVATDVPGIAEVVRDSETALLCPKGDAEALSAACLRVLTDGALAAAMGAAGRQHAMKNFSKDGLASRFVAVLGSKH